MAIHNVSDEGMISMKHLSLVIGLPMALAATAASAQSVNLTGIYTCVQACRGNQPTHVTQNGPSFNLLTEAGLAAQAWPDWFAPASRIWIDAFNEGAVYSPDGMVIQFDNGTIWHRGLPPPGPR
jgi:hypothetical protein